MTLLYPTMLWSLAVLAPLAAIYFLKVRPRRKPTTAYFLWEKILKEHRSSALFQRMRDVWSLLLMALAAAAICFALAQPEWADQRQDLLIVVDNSASMSAGGGRQTRLEEAKQLAVQIIEGLNGSQRAAVASVAHELAYRSHLTDNPRELLDAAATIEPTAETLSPAALAELDAAGSQWQRKRRVLLISDGAFDAKQLAAGVELFKIGAPAENFGIVAADVAYLPGSENRLGVYFRTASSAANDRACDLTLSRIDNQGAETLFKVIPLTIKPGLNAPERFTLDEAPAGRWIARLDVEDALAEDDQTYLVARRPPPIQATVESDDRFFLENSVLAFSGGDDLLQLATKSGEVVIAKSATPEAELAVIFQPAGESPWWSGLGEEVEVVAPRVLMPEHPVLAHIDAAALPYVGARQLKPAAGAQILVADDAGLPLVYVARGEGKSAVVVNLDPVAAEFYFSAWFPVLVHSAVTHLAGRETPLAASYRPGDSAPATGGRDGVESTLVGPAQQSRKISGNQFDLPRLTGFYELRNTSGAWPMSVSLLSADETLLDAALAKDNRRPISQGQSPARWLTVLAIVVLTSESLLYHRRKVG